MSDTQTEHSDSAVNPYLALVRHSPELVRVHDRAGWLGLFGSTGSIEDPVGTPAVRVADGSLASFWDTFIGPNEVEFEVHRDHQVGRAVFRDAIVHTRIAGSVAVDVPAYLLYEVAEDGRSVARMRAFWPLSSLSITALKMGPAAWFQLTKLFGRMLAKMGTAWVGGYLAALWNGIGSRGPRALAQLSAAIENGASNSVVELFANDQARVAFGANERAAVQLLDLFSAGSALTMTDPVSAGWSTAFRFTHAADRGLGLAEFDRASGRISQLRLFPA